MASFSAEVQVDGLVFRVLHCTYEASQGTDHRGQANTKVRRGPVELLLDVPDNDLLGAWATAPAKRLAVDIVFRDANGSSALETLHLDAAYCVGYQEYFESGELTTGAYQCRVTLSDPGGWTISPGGPGGAWQAPSPRRVPAPPPPTWASAPVLEAPETVALVEEASLLARVGAGLLRLAELGTSLPAMLALLVLFPRDLNATEPSLHPPLPGKDARRLAELERRYQAGEELSKQEQAEYLSLLARVRGVHLGAFNETLAQQLRDAELRRIVPDFTGVEIVTAGNAVLGEFDGINMAQKLFIEDKSAEGLNRINPKTGLKAQTPEEWALDKIFSKTEKRIAGLKEAAATRATKEGTAEIPKISEIRGFRKLHFRVDADTPELRNAVETEIKNLRTEHPDWEFTAHYGK